MCPCLPATRASYEKQLVSRAQSEHRFGRPGHPGENFLEASNWFYIGKLSQFLEIRLRRSGNPLHHSMGRAYHEAGIFHGHAVNQGTPPPFLVYTVLIVRKRRLEAMVAVGYDKYFRSQKP